MLKRFYFDVRNGQETLWDHDGVEAKDMEEAIATARSVLSEMADDLASTGIDSPWTLVVRDETGLQVAHIPVGLFSGSDQRARKH